MARSSACRGGSALLSLLLLGACGGGAEHGEAPSEAAVPERIVAITPSLSEILFALGLGRRVVAVGSYATWPEEELARLPRVGGLLDADLEAIAALEPDLAVLLPSEERLANQLGGLGVDVLTVRSETLADVEDSIVAIADRCGVPEAGRRLLSEWVAGLAPMEGPPVPLRVLVTVAREPGRVADFMVAGSATFYDELVRRAGGRNAFADVDMLYPQIGLESALRRDPDLILELQPVPVAEHRGQALSTDWSRVDVGARREPCYQVIAGHHVIVPGPRLPRLYEEIAAAIRACEAAGASERVEAD